MSSCRIRMAAYRLDDLTQVAGWFAPFPPFRPFSPIVSGSLEFALAPYWKGDEENVTVTQVFQAGNPIPVSEHTGSALALSPDGRYFVVQKSEEPRTVSLVETATGKACIVIPQEGNYRHHALFSPDSRYLAVSSGKWLNMVALDKEYAKKIFTLPQDAYPNIFQEIAFSPDGNSFLTEGLYGEAIMFDTESGSELHRFAEEEQVLERRRRENQNSGGSILDRAKRYAESLMNDYWYKPTCRPQVRAAFSEDGSQVITMAAGQILRVWDVESGEEVRVIRTGLPERYNADDRIDNRIFLSANGACAFACNTDGFGTASLWDVSTGTLIAPIEVPEGKIMNVAVADDGSMVYMQIDGDLWFLPGRGKEK